MPREWLQQARVPDERQPAVAQVLAGTDVTGFVTGPQVGPLNELRVLGVVPDESIAGLLEGWAPGQNTTAQLFPPAP